MARECATAIGNGKGETKGAKGGGKGNDREQGGKGIGKELERHRRDGKAVGCYLGTRFRCRKVGHNADECQEQQAKMVESDANKKDQVCGAW